MRSSKLIKSISIASILSNTFTQSIEVGSKLKISEKNVDDSGRQMRGEKVLVARMTGYPGIPTDHKDEALSVGGKVRAIFEPGGSMTIQYELHGLMKDPVCHCCGIAIHDGTSCHSSSDISPWPYFNPDDKDIHGDPWNQEAFDCYALSDYSGETSGSFGIYTGFNYDDYEDKIVVIYDQTGFKIGCGVLYPQDWVE